MCALAGGACGTKIAEMMMICARALLLVASVGSACSYIILPVPGSGISGHRVAISMSETAPVQRKSVQDSRIRMAVEAEAAHSSTQTTQSCTFFRTDQPPKDPSVSCWLADSGFREELDSLEYVCTKDPCIEMERDDHEDHTEDSY